MERGNGNNQSSLLFLFVCLFSSHPNSCFYFSLLVFFVRYSGIVAPSVTPKKQMTKRYIHTRTNVYKDKATAKKKKKNLGAPWWRPWRFLRALSLPPYSVQRQRTHLHVCANLLRAWKVERARELFDVNENRHAKNTERNARFERCHPRRLMTSRKIKIIIIVELKNPIIHLNYL